MALMAGVAGCAALKPPEAEPPVEVEPAPVEPAPQAAPVPNGGGMRDVEPARPPSALAEVERLLDYFRLLRRMTAADLVREYENARAGFARTRSEYDRVRLALLLTLPGTPFNDEARALELLEPMLRSPGSILQGLAVLIYVMAHEQRRLEQNIGKLQEKLDALKSLERKLLEREKPGQTRR